MKTTPNLRRKEEAELIVIEELKSMVSFFVVANGIALLLFGIYGFFKNINFGVFTGLFLGNLTAVLNFYLIGYTAGKAIRRKDPGKARNYFRLSYALRYLTIFGVFGLLMTIKAVNPVAAVLPLTYPSLYYKIKAIFNKTV